MKKVLPPSGTNTVFVVLYANYGDQGVDYKGAFGSRKAAEDFIVAEEPDEHERQWYDIVESEVAG